MVLRHGPREPASRTNDTALLPIIKEAVHNSQALFAYFALTNIDMLVGRVGARLARLGAVRRRADHDHAP